jgi:hypothetical protein
VIACSRRVATSRRRVILVGRRVILACLLAAAGSLTLLWLGLHGTRALAQIGAGTPAPQQDASVPADEVTMIGATPGEAPGSNETWGIGKPRGGQGQVLVRYTSSGGWTLGPALPAAFTLDAQAPSLAAQMTPNGAGVMVGLRGEGAHATQVVLVRNPGGAFRATSPVASEPEGGEEPLLESGEALYGSNRAPLIAPLDEAGGQAGALLAPVNEASPVERQVLHWDGHEWSSEPILIPANSAGEFRVLAIGASSPSNAWMLAQLSENYESPGSVALFRRVAGEGEATPSWKPVALEAGSGDGEAHPLRVPLQGGSSAPLSVAGISSAVKPKTTAQLLTVTGEGVWVDGERAGLEKASTTIFFTPEGHAGGHVSASWCIVPPGAPSGTPPCQHGLVQALPSGPSRSIAWATGAPFGQRVITGLPEGVSLSLEGESFRRVLALGASGGAGANPGALHGAAFTDPGEGWLGEDGPPIHLSGQPAVGNFTPWPVSFRRPLLAIAPQPGAPVGALSSEALAVGGRGQVARYRPGVGWLPETLFGLSQKAEEPNLRSIAWPTPNRAYAVGDEGQMWLWRGETGLWERDPATPLNFRDNLLGIAFDPSNPSRGYAVGTTAAGLGGVLLRYGKTWTQEAPPPQAANAALTSIAFAGSEAIVSYTKEVVEPGGHVGFRGGLIVNDGSGWRVDEEAAALIGGDEPRTVAGLGDGGAAFSTSGPGGSRLFERQTAESPWQATATPPPASLVGSIALFREGASLRAMLAGGGAANPGSATPPPPGFPPDLYEALPLVGTGAEDAVLRQTAGGWSDETREIDTAEQPEGGYVRWDLPYGPDPALAVLIDPNGSQGWAVGGSLGGLLEATQTSSVERYQQSGTPTGVEAAPVALNPGDATFAIGGHAQCADPCADRSLARVGPQVWLGSALALAKQIGVRAFLYAGPYVAEGSVSGHRSIPIDFGDELERFASILASSAPGLGVFPAVAPQELDERPEEQGSEATFERVFSGFPQPLGGGPPLPGLAPAPEGRSQEQCTIGAQCAYYAFDSEGPAGTVRVIVLDESRAEVGATQLEWLGGQLRSAKGSHEPAIVLGSAKLTGTSGANVVRMLLGGGNCLADACASAYFYDAPEANERQTLQLGSEQIPAYGTGTLGYVNAENELRGDFHGASGILLGQVEFATYDTTTNLAKVSARLIPVIGELAMEARDGILLRRSFPASFAGLARRPRAGNRAVANQRFPEVDPYIPIPSNCVGAACAAALLPEYEFISSNREIGDFVAPNLAVKGGNQVLEGPDGKPIPDAQSGLFCAYNPGETRVTIRAGGLAYSLPVVVERGSVRQPCGTVPLKHLQAVPQPVSVSPPASAPAATPTPASSGPPPVVPLPPAPPVAAPPPSPHATPAPPPFVPLAVAPTPVLAFVPPPLPTPARPTPPSGTSAVTSPVEIAEEEEEEEGATEHASNQAVAYRAHELEPSSAYILGAIVLGAFAGASIRRRARAGRREVRIAPATVSTLRSQRRWERRGRW